VRVKSPRWTAERFKLASQAGCFHDMVEMTEGPEHRNTVEDLVEMFAAVFDKEHWYVARESSVEFADWTPLPDIAVCRGPRKPTYSHRAPRPADIVLLVKVSQSTYRFDRRVKLPRYAKAGIPLLWIVNLESRAIEVFSEPRGRRYASLIAFAEEQSVSLKIADPEGVVDGFISVSDVLP